MAVFNQYMNLNDFLPISASTSYISIDYENQLVLLNSEEVPNPIPTPQQILQNLTVDQLNALLNLVGSGSTTS